MKMCSHKSHVAVRNSSKVSAPACATARRMPASCAEWLRSNRKRFESKNSVEIHSGEVRSKYEMIRIKYVDFFPYHSGHLKNM